MFGEYQEEHQGILLAGKEEDRHSEEESKQRLLYEEATPVLGEQQGHPELLGVEDDGILISHAEGSKPWLLSGEAVPVLGEH